MMHQQDVAALLTSALSLGETALGVPVNVLIIVVDANGGCPIQIANIPPPEQFDLMGFCLSNREALENHTDHFVTGSN